MKYKSKIIIEKSLAEVMTKLLNRDNMEFWMKGFKTYELHEGKFFQEGSKALLKLDIGVTNIEMIEKIIDCELPFSYKASYEAQGVTNIVNNTFQIIDEENTLWIQESEFKFKNFAVKTFSNLVVSLFKKISQSTLDNFKVFVEEK